MPRKLTVADVCQVTGYSRDELHALLKGFAPYSGEQTAARVAREFTPLDLVVLSVTAVLEHRCGVRRTAVAELGEKLYDALSGPKGLNRTARLVITIRPPAVSYLDGADDADGLFISLAPILERVDGHLNFDRQLSLPLGVSAVLTRRQA